jgi:hypothetical protein
MAYRGKVSTVFTLLIINNLSVYTIPYIFLKVSTSLAVNYLSVYINDNVKRCRNHGTIARPFLSSYVKTRPLHVALRFRDYISLETR